MRIFISTLALCALTACTALGLERSQGIPDTIVQQYANVEGLANAGKRGADARLVSEKDGRAALKIASAAQDLLEGAEAAVGLGDLSTAEARLTAAIGLLEQVNAYLEPRLKQQTGPPPDVGPQPEPVKESTQ